MIRGVILDSGPLGRIAHPRKNREIASWLQQLLTSSTAVFLPEIADYEVRRNLLLEGLANSIKRLDQLKDVLIYLPLTTHVMLKAAELWADARKRGQPTADPKELDGDVRSLQDIFFINETNGWLLSPHNEVFKTADGGKTWELLSQVDSISIQFINENVGWALAPCCPPALFKTTDGGKTWLEQRINFAR